MKKNKGESNLFFLFTQLFLIWIWKYWKESTGNIRRKENIRNMDNEDTKHLSEMLHSKQVHIVDALLTLAREMLRLM